MSDKDLVELIRSAPWSDGFPYLKETADRIEELEAKLKNMSMLWAKADAEKQASLGRIEELEAKLAKAVEALQWCSGSADFNDGGIAREGWLKLCGPLIAELKGEK